MYVLWMKRVDICVWENFGELGDFPREEWVSSVRVA